MAADFQSRVQPWMHACFGPEISADKVERNHRFLEEALELVQATGCTQSEAHQLVDYVFSRPVGEPRQELGGVMVTLAALSLAQGFDMHDAAEVELARVWTKVEAIREKQRGKPKHSPLPGPSAPEPGKVVATWHTIAKPAKRIPITAAKRIAEEFGQQQVILVTWDGGTTHVVTFGTTQLACEQAAVGGNKVKAALGWPPELCNARPARAKRKAHPSDVQRMQELLREACSALGECEDRDFGQLCNRINKFLSGETPQ